MDSWTVLRKVVNSEHWKGMNWVEPTVELTDNQLADWMVVKWGWQLVGRLGRKKAGNWVY
jgi:hypothetical protein